MKAWLLDDPSVELSKGQLDDLGVLTWVINPETLESDGHLDRICKERNYNYRDIIRVCPEHLPNYEQKIKTFFEEHLHLDEEIRFFLGGSGYFDVRDKEDRWVRIHAGSGDMLVLPAGIYHRFSTDEKNFAHVMRLFQGDPVWTPYNRGQEADLFPVRGSYLKWLSEHK